MASWLLTSKAHGLSRRGLIPQVALATHTSYKKVMKKSFAQEWTSNASSLKHFRGQRKLQKRKRLWKILNSMNAIQSTTWLFCCLWWVWLQPGRWHQAAHRTRSLIQSSWRAVTRNCIKNEECTFLFHRHIGYPELYYITALTAHIINWDPQMLIFGNYWNEDSRSWQ